MSFSLARPRAVLALACLGLALPLGSALAEEPTPDEVIAAFEKISGVHAGLRRNHAKGTCAVGEFQATGDARSLSMSTLFSGQPVPVIARFSLAGPNPKVPDTARNPRAMALSFDLPDGEEQRMAMLHTPVFGASSVESFHERQLADIPDATGKRDPAKLAAYKAKYPEGKAQGDWLATHNPPPSFTETAYYSLHAFQFIAEDKTARWVKWRFEPQDGVHVLGDEELKTLPGDFLVQRLTERTRKGPVRWDMVVSLGQDGDPIDNPAVAWPADRQEITVGTLTLTRAGDDAVGQCEDINFDPNVLSTGIEASPDALLAYRSPAYAVSHGKRLEEKTE
jgi:catalase